MTVFVFYGLIALVESLDTWRFTFVAEQFGLPMAVVMVAMSAVRWTIKTLPVTVLMGAILGFLDLKARHELTVIQSSGISIWRAVRAPTIVLALVSLDRRARRGDGQHDDQSRSLSDAAGPGDHADAGRRNLARAAERRRPLRDDGHRHAARRRRCWAM